MRRNEPPKARQKLSALSGLKKFGASVSVEPPWEISKSEVNGGCFGNARQGRGNFFLLLRGWRAHVQHVDFHLRLAGLSFGWLLG